jgi:uncharacterized hydrophobic protein (TIGR00271 family)
MKGSAEAGIVHVRLIVPATHRDRVIETLSRSEAVINVVTIPHGSVKPPGDFVLCDVAREEVSVIVDRLRTLGALEHGSISIDEVDSILSPDASRAVLAATGSASDAVVWEEVEARTSQSAELSINFVIFMVLATAIAAIGILTDSQVLIIGAMVIGPEFGPLAGLCVAIVQRRSDVAVRSAIALAVGFPAAIAVTLLLVLAVREAGVAPDTLPAQSRPETFFISHPNTFSVLVALVAGVAGMLSLTTARSGALVGVLISVTTIPAAGNIAVALAYGDAGELGGAAAQLGINLVCIVVAGVATLLVQRRGFSRRLRHSTD